MVTTPADQPILSMLARSVRYVVVLCALLVRGIGDAAAQEHPFIGSYALTELSGGISVDWSLQSGSTCNGQDVERSTDSVEFIPVHHIDGICGDAGSSVLYHWFDPAPAEFSTVYYRLKLGIDGYSSIKAIFFGQLLESEQRFFPNPLHDTATLVMHVRPSAAIDLRIHNMAGSIVMTQRATTGPSIAIDMTGFPAGVYGYTAVSGGRTFHGRFVKE